MSAAVGTLDRRESIDSAAAALMLLLTFSWGLNGVAAKVSNIGFSPIFVTVSRSMIAAVLVFLWCRFRGIRLFEKDGTLWSGLLAGLLFGAEFFCIFFGLDYTTVARSALMVNTMPFWVLLGAHFLLGEKISTTKLGGLTLAFAGVVLVFSDKLSLPGPQAIKGDLLSLCAGGLWAATTLVIKSTKLTHASAEKTLLYQLAVSAVLVAPLIPLAGPALREVSALRTGALLFQAIYVVAFTYILWFWLMRRYPAAGLSSFAFLTPAFGVLLGGLLLKEPLSIRIFLALALIAVGLIIVNRPQRKKA
ncbi:DMT family transporter [Mesorhizobium sp. BAC0120]|uniref:DMT family transporter n=1 Tax=Mesorhizobium sp. BAC0120 TaxID=3090670 RepID=UPI00298C6B9F|nr:DMT family transporter [Mesorhizobium sp. BAC0120]MDW6023739.1 DMT family transporter [Mesorhizobium sp. BAC0120]